MPADAPSGHVVRCFKFSGAAYLGILAGVLQNSAAVRSSKRPVLAERRPSCSLIRSRGIGERTAALVLAQMPELGTLNRREAAALAGLAPFNRDSGTLRGKRTIFAGRRALRCGLYMAALVASRHNPILSNFYRRLRSKDKPHKLALTAVMRKLLLALNQTLSPTQPLA